MGLEAKKVYLYDDNGKYLRDFESISEFARTFNFPDNILSNRGRSIEDTFEFEDGRVASLNRIGRKGVFKYKEYKNSPYVGRGKKIAKSKDKGFKVEIYDLDGDKMAEFESVFHAISLTSLTKSMFFYANNRGGGSFKTRDGLMIKYVKK